ncbi:hypothetical protein ABAC460_05955 [Asticcacaulis sp. AC460]|uniref:calcium-binding protein n=1 Tax=Asticcacaulis sp. AC460 TaxID=1282360 RepID=UPI0003C3E0E7|nr:calcium-binding protein [Asticcacaulis sp. AC460]ESQ91526.1 hypothetical protein ABAC460_05955 [Asticcacaulis sp. AC460]
MLHVEAEAESQVNTENSDLITGQTITLLTNGNYVVTWRAGTYYGEGVGQWWEDVHAQMFDADGNRLGGEFLVNTTTEQDQGQPRAIALGDGGFVILWTSITYVPESIVSEEFIIQSSTIMAQRYDAAGLRVNLLADPDGDTGEVVLSADGLEPLIAMKDDGSFVLAWQTSSNGSEGFQLTFVDDAGEITGTVFHAVAEAIQPEILTLGDKVVLVYAAQDWESSVGGRTSFDVFSQAFDASGAAVGGRVKVNTYTTRSQSSPSVVATETGGYIVVWQSTLQDGSLLGVYGQVFDGSSQKVGSEFRVNTTTSGSQSTPEITALDNGKFAVVWTSNPQDGDGNGAYLQLIDSSGHLIGGEIQIADETIGSQSGPKITSDGDTLFVVWNYRDAADHPALMTRQFQITVPFPDENANDLEGDANADNIDGLGGADTIHGLSGADTLSGSGGIDALYGDDGNDWLDGGSGIDAYHGGLGDDTFVVNSAGETVDELSGEGTDTVRTVVSLTLAANVENLVLLGGANLSGTGNGLNNVLTGNAGNNILSGGLGDDTYYIQNAGDSVEEKHGEGNDTVCSSVSYSLFGRAVETLILTGGGNLNATGNSLNNTLTGTSGNNLLDGGTGADKMTGGLGDDTYYVDHVQDNVAETHWQGNDTVISSVSYSLFGRAVETLVLTGTGNLNATGNSLANVLTGNAGANTLDGGTGNDMLTGGLGADIFLFTAASGKDTVSDFSGVQNDTINVNAYTAGAANAAMVTQAGANVLVNLGGGNTVTVLNASQADVLAHMVW